MPATILDTENSIEDNKTWLSQSFHYIREGINKQLDDVLGGTKCSEEKQIRVRKSRMVMLDRDVEERLHKAVAREGFFDKMIK